MTAVAIGKYFKVPGNKIKQAIEAYIPTNNRSQIVRKGSNTFILDAYNANPTSMREAVLNLSRTEAPRKVAILGDMLELGTFSESEHKAIIDFALEQKVEEILLVGQSFAAPAAKRQLPHFENITQLRDWFNQQVYEDTHFLVKGSRGIRLEQLFD
ncbi:MAG: cyanophycin synthetase [Bacteroidota bacterium]